MKIRKLIKSLLIMAIPVFGISQTGLLDSSKVVLPHTGSQALEFGLSGLFNIGGYVGNTIALKKFSSQRRATRYVLDISSGGYDLSGTGHEIDYNPFPADSTIDSSTFDYTSKSTYQDFFLSMQWLRYQQPYGNLSLLIGVGPLIGFEQTIRDNAIDPRARGGESDWYDNKEVSTGVYLGLLPVVGIEWFLHRNISFHAEYYSLITVGWRVVTDDYAREYSNGDWYESDSDLSGVYYNVRGYARAGVSFYFK